MPDKTLGEIGLLKRKNEIKETKELFATRERDITPPGDPQPFRLPWYETRNPLLASFVATQADSKCWCEYLRMLAQIGATETTLGERIAPQCLGLIREALHLT